MNHPLPVLMPRIPNQRWSCHSCANCCKSLVGHLFDSDRRRIDVQNWKSEIGVDPYVKLGREWVLNRTADDSCVFLDEHGLCRIHAKFGEAAKPFACRIFPFSVRPSDEGWRVSFRLDCPSAASSKGEPLSKHAGLVRELIGSLPPMPTSADPPTRLRSGLELTRGEERNLEQRIGDWLHNRSIGIADRVVGLSWLVGTMSDLKYDAIRGGRFAELLDILKQSLPGESALKLEPPTQQALAMLRQLAFAHAEHVSQRDVMSRGYRAWKMRLVQLYRARVFRKGTGAIPQLRGFGSVKAAFSKADSLRSAESDGAAIADLLERYVVGRWEGGTLWGAGYYGWPALLGGAALCLSYAVIGWLARIEAAKQGRDDVAFADVAFSVSVVSRAASRLPALGGASERIRASYLMRDGNIARLIRRFPLTK